MRVAIAGGGTGGHIIPALAIADELKNTRGADVLIIGTPRGLESQLVPQAGYPLSLIPVGQLNNVSFSTKVRTVADLPLGLARCGIILHKFQPDVVIGVGGYASGPMMVAAILSRIPTLAYEPNAYPGMANRIVGGFVSAAAVSFPEATKYFRNAQITGVPVRAEFFNLRPRPAGSPPHLLIFGGSQGARIFNTIMPQIAAALLAAVPGLTILHQAGARHEEATLAAYQASGAPPDRWEVHAFLDDMPRRYEAADLILSRSGATTVAEHCAAGKASLLVPFPLAADDHQRKNAEAMVGAGAARMLLEDEITPERLQETIVRLLTNRFELEQMSRLAKKLALPDATKRIASMVRAIMR